jgi:hypothetical protein
VVVEAEGSNEMEGTADLSAARLDEIPTEPFSEAMKMLRFRIERVIG